MNQLQNKALVTALLIATMIAHGAATGKKTTSIDGFLGISWRATPMDVKMRMGLDVFDEGRAVHRNQAVYMPTKNEQRILDCDWITNFIFEKERLIGGGLYRSYSFFTSNAKNANDNARVLNYLVGKYGIPIFVTINEEDRARSDYKDAISAFRSGQGSSIGWRDDYGNIVLLSIKESDVAIVYASNYGRSVLKTPGFRGL
jgi:hypothetical protein